MDNYALIVCLLLGAILVALGWLIYLMNTLTTRLAEVTAKTAAHELPPHFTRASNEPPLTPSPFYRPNR